MTPSQYWLVETATLSQFADAMSEIDIPFDSNVLLMTKNSMQNVDLYDVYRPSALSAIRYL